VRELAKMTEEEFREAFSDSPGKRAKWRGMRRNIVAVLSASGEPDALDTLEELLEHPEALVRQRAAPALRGLRETEAPPKDG
jgi:epoxyqueuosine reductase QueG